ncbi:MAG: MFS transporter [Luteitalea sp.]|nr:MFS transporter [Luteitalea sp.]
MQSQRALTFIVLLGVVSLFADVTYEGARSAAGPFLAMLGASALIVSVVSGDGELVGYALRLWSGRLADRTQHYWAITFAGYAINLLAVPLLALAGNWPIAACLMVLERTGKALRTPARDAMLSYATKSTGRGWGFGLHEALDQIGATTGPLIVAGVVMQGGNYRDGFAVLLIPALAALSTLGLAWRLYPRPQELEPADLELSARGFPKEYWIYLIGSCLVAAGYADYALLAYHFHRAATVPLDWIPALYGLAMAVDAVAALLFGRWFDRAGVRVLVVSTLLSASFALFAFGDRQALAVLGTILWGIGMGAQESIMRAAIADMAPQIRRATAYGVFNLTYGASWFAGSALMGWLYSRSMLALLGFSVIVQVAAVPCFLMAARARR